MAVISLNKAVIGIGCDDTEVDDDDDMKLIPGPSSHLTFGRF